MKQGQHIAYHITMYTLAIGMTITLLVLWNVYLVGDYDTVKNLMGERYNDSTRWVVLILGCVFFAVIMMIISIYFASILRNKRFFKLQQDFVNLTTHELKTPLTNISLFSQTILEHKPDIAKTHEFVSHIYSEATYLSELVVKLLETRALDSKRTNHNPESINLKEFFKNNLSRYLREYTLTCPDYIYIDVDAYYFLISVNTVLTNIDKYAPEGRADIRAKIVKKQCRITFKDQGPGLPDKELKKIFRRFYQSQKRTTEYKRGVGLGLFLLKEIVDMHKGSVRAYNNVPGPGLTIEINLPLAKKTHEQS